MQLKITVPDSEVSLKIQELQDDGATNISVAKNGDGTSTITATIPDSVYNLAAQAHASAATAHASAATAHAAMAKALKRDR